MNFKEMIQAAWVKYDEKLNAQKSLLGNAQKENRTLTDEEEKNFDSLQLEMDGLEKEAKRLEKMLESEQKSGSPASAPLPLPASHDTQKEVKDNHGFKSLGEFLTSVIKGYDAKGRLSKSMLGTDDSGSNAGGFLIPPEFSSNMLTIPAELPFVRNYATVLPDEGAPDTSITIPTIDYSENMYGGITLDWVAAEGGDKPETTMKFKTISLNPNELAGWMAVSDKLLRNSSAIESIITTNFRNALLNTEQKAFLFGDGDNKPTGVLNSANTGIVTVNREAAGELSYIDIIAVRSRMTTESYLRSVWVISQVEMPDIIGMTDTSGRLIYLPGSIVTGAGETLLGRPIIWTNEDTGVALIDFSSYLIKDGSGPYVATSEHVHFLKNQTIIKIFEYVDGKPWVALPITHSNGLKTSPYIVLGSA